MRLATPLTGAALRTKYGNVISMWPASASSRAVISVSMSRKDLTVISYSWLFRMATKRDMWVPLKLWGSSTYMLKVAMVCCSPWERSRTRTGWRIPLIPTLSIAMLRVSGLPCTSAISAAGFRTSIAIAFVVISIVPRVTARRPGQNGCGLLYSGTSGRTIYGPARR